MPIPIAELEQAAAGGWRAPDQAALGRWLLRSAGGFTGRANSALAAGDPGLPLAGAIDEIGRWYRARGLPAMVSVPFPLGRPHASEVDRFLSDRGWPVSHGAIVMTAAAVQGGPADIPVDLTEEPDEGWLSLYRPRGRPPPPMAGRLLMSAPWQAFASVRQAGHVVAIGRVAVAGGWAGLTAIEVHPPHRRRGLGLAITAALAAAAPARGVTGFYLQVGDDNAAARTLYRRLGFADHHAYHYRVMPR
jgi:ribosomal protein S18 acetylase RimI-like enzyme